MEATVTDRDSNSRAWVWPVIVVGMLVGHATLMILVVLLATQDKGFSVEPDYYQKAISWDDTAAQRVANEQLGWSVALTLGDTMSAIGDRELICTLVDRDGIPLDGSTVEVEFFPHARGQQRTFVLLEGTGDGRYAGKCRFLRKGVYEFRVKIERGPQTFTLTETRDVYPPGEARPWRP